jgi:hypothetical protein
MRHRVYIETRRLLATVAALLVTTAAFAAEPIERFTAFAVDMGNARTGRTRAGTVDITIERWTTDQERDNLLAALKESGSDGLLRTLQKIKPRVGYIQSAGRLGYDLKFARQVVRDDGSQRVLIATDRAISFLEAVNRPRTVDYPFMVIDMRLSAKGEGEGKLLPIANITANGDHVVEIENYDTQPVRLTSIKNKKTK